VQQQQQQHLPCSVDSDGNSVQTLQVRDNSNVANKLQAVSGGWFIDMITEKQREGYCGVLETERKP